MPTVLESHCLLLLFLLLLFYCCYYQTVATDNKLGNTTHEDCEQELFPGAPEPTQLLRLSSILWIPLCRINKLGNTTREDCCDPLYLWVIKTIFWCRCRGA